jgi:glutamate N-acetyltransferase / amino-acid N-acetyltransferase
MTQQSTLPQGFRFAAVKAGLKKSGRTDFACIVADAPASAAAMFTSNRVTAAPLAIDKQHLHRTGGLVRVVAINAGNANCATGEAGLHAAIQVCQATAATFGCEPAEVFPSSTGIIGVPLPAEKLVAALPEIKAALGNTWENFEAAAQAILTTDLKQKTAVATVQINGKPVRLAAFGKGSGMIHPQLVPHATMLVYILTDAVIQPSELRILLHNAVEVSFNRISVDGDTSTNDTVLLLASGASGVPVTATDSTFQAALTEVCTSIARQIVADGEGVTHVVQLEITGASTDADALKVAKAIAHSPLVKTAWAGNDPNWGRLIAAIGYSGVAIDPAKIDIWFGDLEICRKGGRSSSLDEKAAHDYCKQPEFTIKIDLNLAQGRCRFWTTDLTHEYISINADYSS